MHYPDTKKYLLIYINLSQMRADKMPRRGEEERGKGDNIKKDEKEWKKISVWETKDKDEKRKTKWKKDEPVDW